MREAGDLKTCRRGAEWALAAATAQELGLFEALARGPATASRLASALSLNSRGTAILLGALEEMGLVRAEAEEGEEVGGEPVYRLTGRGRARFVDRDTPDFEGDATRLWLANIRRWALDLPEAVRRGAPPPGTGRAGQRWTEDEEEALARFMAAMANKDPATVARVAEACLGRLPGAPEARRGRPPGRLRVLDLGGGPGVFARAFLERGAEVMLADRPEVIEHVARRYGLDSLRGLRLWRGDFLQELPEERFDLVFLANITHIYDPETNANLLRRLADRLRPGGVLAILDFVRGLSDFAGVFAITMLLNTEGGNTYSRARYEEWLRAAGLGDFRFDAVDADRHLITARRSGARHPEVRTGPGAEPGAGPQAGG